MALIIQLISFAGIGILNTAIDFAVLNLLASFLGVYTGIGIGIINAASFTVAVFHSYYWNKVWAFSRDNSGLVRNIGRFVTALAAGGAVLFLVIWGSRQQYSWVYYLIVLIGLALGEIVMWKVFRLKAAVLAGVQREVGTFIAITLVGLLINSGIVVGVTKFIPPAFGFNQELWTNVAKAGATAVSLIWNFAGYRLFVFKK
ncbi:MAG: GtrA family protein [Candidatus Doudnabacteria bacterium]|nr:GtrA family protein [bacterium]MDZ4243971.1 GtrA family protein [Candidatus Doudnabacteria bacterium]